MKYFAAPFFGTIIVCLAACGEKEIAQTGPADYFGQQPPEAIAGRFAPGIVSTPNHEHSRIEFSSDGNELYWVSVPVDSGNILVYGTPFRVQDQNIWYSRFDGQKWSKPDTLPFDLPAKQSPAYLSTREYLYFGSVISDSNLTKRIWRTSKTADGWADPVPGTELPIPARNASFCFAKNGNLYFDSFAGINEQGRPSWVIYMAEFEDGTYSEPQILGGGINDGGLNWTPWVAPDESYILFSSHRVGHLGSGDLYISFRDESGEWSEPTNMGPLVNTSSQERFPSVSPDGRFLFFARNTDDAFSDIYWIDAAFIEDLREASQ